MLNEPPMVRSRILLNDYVCVGFKAPYLYALVKQTSKILGELKIKVAVLICP
jgi:hypothetical protein